MDALTQQSSQAAHIPKRGARACTACRKGKNRCEGEVRELFYGHFRILQKLLTGPLTPTARVLCPRPAGTLPTLSAQWNALRF